MQPAPQSFILIYIIIIIIASFHFTCCHANNRTMCPEKEKQALLRFKHSAEDPSKPSQVLSSWKPEVDCCRWEGVVCNNITGNVLELSLYGSGLIGELDDSLLNLTHLTYLDLGHNMLHGTIPSGFANMCIRILDLSNNNLRGDISYAFENMSNCFLETLEELVLGNNHLYGNLTYLFQEFKGLFNLHLANNTFSGPIPSSLGKLVSLQKLSLNDNKFTGNLPDSMGQLFNLAQFDVSYNMLEGFVTETHFANLTNLHEFWASGNHLTLKVSDNWIPNFKIGTLFLGSWNLGAEGRIPEWINRQNDSLYSLDLCNTGITYDQVPIWLWEISFHLNLSHNKLRGSIHDVVLATLTIDLSSNMFHGSLPQIDATSVGQLDLSNNSFSGRLDDSLCHNNDPSVSNLWFLNLERNLLSGELPDCLMKFRSLVVLNLGNNNITGRIPKSIGNLNILEYLDLFDNRLSGQIPSSIQKCTKLWKIDLSNNQLIGEIPAWIGINLPDLNILILRSNKLAGKISSSICHLNYLRILDLSNNNFFGIIPRCMYNLTAMASSEWIIPFHNNSIVDVTRFHDSATVATKGTWRYYDSIIAMVTIIDLSSNNFSGDIPKELTTLAQLRFLNLSRNHLNGVIPDGIEDMKVLESLDLSNNFLSGKIPQSIVVLSSLSYLDLSYNNLSGEIPHGTQIMTFPPSRFVGNDLCGPPRTSSCNPPGSGPQGHEKDDEDDKSGVKWLYDFVTLGYAVGLAMVFNILVFKKSWRWAFFESVDNMWDKLSLYARKKRSCCRG